MASLKADKVSSSLLSEYVNFIKGFLKALIAKFLIYTKIINYIIN